MNLETDEEILNSQYETPEEIDNLKNLILGCRDELQKYIPHINVFGFDDCVDYLLNNGVTICDFKHYNSGNLSLGYGWIELTKKYVELGILNIDEVDISLLYNSVRCADILKYLISVGLKINAYGQLIFQNFIMTNRKVIDILYENNFTMNDVYHIPSFMRCLTHASVIDLEYMMNNGLKKKHFLKEYSFPAGSQHTPLVKIALYGNDAIFSKILECGFSNEELFSSNLLTLLCEMNAYKKIQLLIFSKMDSSIIKSNDDLCIRICINLGHVESLELLLLYYENIPFTSKIQKISNIIQKFNKNPREFHYYTLKTINYHMQIYLNTILVSDGILQTTERNTCIKYSIGNNDFKLIQKTNENLNTVEHVNILKVENSEDIDTKLKPEHNENAKNELVENCTAIVLNNRRKLEKRKSLSKISAQVYRFYNITSKLPQSIQMKISRIYIISRIMITYF